MSWPYQKAIHAAARKLLNESKKKWKSNMTTAMYISLSYDDYKEIERQMREFTETSHKTEPGFYHKSIRLKITKDVVFEFHGPLVKAGEAPLEVHGYERQGREVPTEEKELELESYIDPRTGKPRASIARQIFARLIPDEQNLYQWDMHAQRWVYHGIFSDVAEASS